MIATKDLKKADEIEGWWCVSWDSCIKNFYVRGNKKTEDGSWKKVRLHRWLLDVTDAAIQVDHIMRDTLDNCRWALRKVTPSENSQNKRVPSNNTSGHRGVYWNGRRSMWEARLDVNRKTIYLGYYKNKLDAAKARKEAEKKYWVIEEDE
ncbi:MAG: hypothetical protein ACQEUO_07360 [Bacillota bacterium]